MVLTLLLGGARCGKSALAIDLARGREGLPVTFLATAEPVDREIAERIDRHRAERPGDWETLEEPIELERALGGPTDGVVVVDCLTLWVSNMLGRRFDDVTVLQRAAHFATRAHERPGPVIVVSNEVGSGIVPADALSRRYRDALGRVNATFAARSDEAFLVVAGRVLALSRPVTPSSPVAPDVRRRPSS